MGLIIFMLCIFCLFFASFAAADDPCSKAKPPPSTMGCYCFFTSFEEVSKEMNDTASSVPDQDAISLPSDAPNICLVAAIGKIPGVSTSTPMPLAYYLAGNWTLGLDESMTMEICKNGTGIPGISFTKDHGKDPLCDDKSGSGGSYGKGCYSMDTEVVMGEDWPTILRMSDVESGKRKQVLFMQHSTNVVKKDVLCVKNIMGRILCGTGDHIVKYFGKRYSMNEVCKFMECYERKDVRVVNPVLKSGVIGSPLEGFELTDEVEWDLLPRIITTVGAWFLRVAIDFGNFLTGDMLALVVSKETL